MAELDHRLHVFRPDLADARLAGNVEASRFTDGELCRVVAPHAPVRRAPSATAMLLTEALFGELVRVYDRDEEAGWAWAQLERDRYVGWLPAEALAESAPEPTHKVAALRTLAFSGPDIKQPPLFDLPLGSRVAVQEEAEDKNARYALIAPAGAVVTQHLSRWMRRERWTGWPSGSSASPYLWGGKTALGLDCSGLVQVALQACGIAAPARYRHAGGAAGRGCPRVAGPDLQRGDLVFWSGHVGIMRDSRTCCTAMPTTWRSRSSRWRGVERLEARGARVTSFPRLRANRRCNAGGYAV
jgi:hypothetical protein